MTATNHAVAATDRPPLFRPEVAERNWEILESRGLMPQPPRHATLVIAVLTVVFTAVGIFIARGGFPRVEFAPGYLEPTAGVVRMRAPRQSIIGAIYVKDGQRVANGDSLVTLQSGQTMESGAAAEAEIAASSTANTAISRFRSSARATGDGTRNAASTRPATSLPRRSICSRRRCKRSGSN